MNERIRASLCVILVQGLEPPRRRFNFAALNPYNQQPLVGMQARCGTVCSLRKV